MRKRDQGQFVHRMTPFDKDYEEILKESKNFVSRWNGAASGRILTMYGPHAPYTCPPEFLKAVALEAERDGVGIHIHLAETSKEVEDMKEKYGGHRWNLLPRQVYSTYTPLLLTVSTLHNRI